MIHRSVTNFVVQGGGYKFVNGAPQEILSDPPVINEFAVSNTRGTIAMAKLGSNPNSATNQWFFNLGDNSRNLNTQNSGFTVFGRITDDAGLAVMDRIAAVPVPNPPVLNSPFDQMPLIDYRGGQVTESNLVIVRSITVLDPSPAPAIAANGIISASSFGGQPAATAGSFIEIYGTNLAGSTRGWDKSDFTGVRAPTALDGIVVTVNGQPAYVNFVSPTQINAQVPATVPANRAVPVMVLYRGQWSEAGQLTLKPHAGGLLAPASFKVDGKQFVAAAHSTTGGMVSNGAIPGNPAAPAAPGETLVFYGTGFGPVTPLSFPIAGQIAAGFTTVSTPVQFQIGELTAQVLYAGHVPDLVGVYQFNVTVPTSAPTGDLPLRVTVGGEAIPQILFLPVRAAGN
jgi:uncharacterized protein (TIGR03437 family)